MIDISEKNLKIRARDGRGISLSLSLQKPCQTLFSRLQKEKIFEKKCAFINN